MSRYSRGYIQTHDIDWFCILDDRFPILLDRVGECCQVSLVIETLIEDGKI